MLWVVDKKNFEGFVKTFLNDEGRCPYSGKTAQDFVYEGYSILNDEEYYRLATEYEKSLCGKWKEIDEDTYEEMLNVLPPVGWHDGGFFMSERYIGNVSSFYQAWRGKFYTSLQRVGTPRKDILDDLMNFIGKNVEKLQETT